MPSDDLLPRLVARERAKRLLASGVVLTAITLGWLVVAWRGSRFVETTCTIERVPDKLYCAAVRTREDGLRQESVGDDCLKPHRWKGVPIGGALPCWYFQAWPERVDVERPEPIVLRSRTRDVLLSLGLVLLAAGVLLLARTRASSRAVDHDEKTDEPYRAAPPSEPRPIPLPSRLPIVSSTGPLRWLIGAPFAVLGGAIAILAAMLGIEATGTVRGSDVLIGLFGPAVFLLGLLSISFRSGLIVDPARGLLWSWWGPWDRQWLRSYHSLHDVRAATAEQRTGRHGLRWFVLQIAFVDGTTQTFSCEDAHGALAQVNAALRLDRGPRS